MSGTLMPVVFVPHGGGPMPLMGDPGHEALSEFMKGIASGLAVPAAILVITAHWEEAEATISSNQRPGMIYDYYGFPPETYKYQYPAPGNPSLAQKLVDLLAAEGLPARLDPERGYDHGAFVPLMLMYPAATVPVLQLSLVKSLDPATHIAIGRALAPLRDHGVLILGSGMSFHNMQAFSSPNANTRSRSYNFDQWLTETLCAEYLGVDERNQRLLDWKQAPEARFCHPREEHLLPLHVCYGAASVASPKAQRVFSDFLFNTKISSFLWR
jgi:aromatic ring-opening dioxygenase catalytic subunit (LigB family)